MHVTGDRKWKTKQIRPVIQAGINFNVEQEKNMNAGPGRSSAGGGKHKRRRGRRPPRRGAGGPMGRERQEQQGIFTAPMDHSYRANMGMDNGSGNGNGRAPRRPG